MNAILLTPTPITKDTVNLAIDAGHITKEQACEGAMAGVQAASNRLICGAPIHPGSAPFLLSGPRAPPWPVRPHRPAAARIRRSPGLSASWTRT